MANPKYADLPGIAFDQPDVYETSDLPESEQLPQDIIGDHSDSVVKITLAPSEAYEKFKDHTLTSKDIDFTDSIGRKRKTGYEFHSREYEILGTGSKEEETPEQKYNRLQLEIADLIEDIEKIKGDSEKLDLTESVSSLQKKSVDLQNKLVGLNLEEVLRSSPVVDLSNPFGAAQRNLLSQIESAKEDLANIKVDNLVSSSEASDSVLSYELYLKPHLAKTAEPYKIVQLEERIKKLESIIGHDSNKMSALTIQTNDKSIVAAINILSARTALLDATNLEQIEPRLAAVQQRLAALSSTPLGGAGSRGGSEEGSNEQRRIISELYDLARRAEAMGANLPSLVDHLVSIKDLHVQALQFSKALTHLDTSQQQMVNMLQRNEKLLKEVQENSIKNMEMIQKNIQNIEKRINSLQS